MTWELQSPVSDDIHRLVNDKGRTLWGVTHRGFDVDHPDALGVVEVEMPTGPTSLLLVEPFAGGFVLDAVRSYQGLVEGELRTLFLGVVDELLSSSDAQSRLSLECIGLDADGRPRIIPGISRTPPSSMRLAIGEMIYHAAYGRPWAQSPLPVAVALSDFSQPVQNLAAFLLDDSVADTGLSSTLAEVSATLRRTGTPSALPLLPAERDLDPGLALTARLRAAKTPGDVPQSTARTPTAPPTPTTNSTHSTESVGTAGRLRAASRHHSRNKGQGPRRNRRSSSGSTRISSWLATHRSSLVKRLPKRGRRVRGWKIGARTWAMLAVCTTIIGGFVMVSSWSSGESPASVSSSQGVSPSDQPTSSPTGSPVRDEDLDHGDASGLSESQIVDLLEDLCQRRSDALSAGDDRALAALTVPNSAAAAADELLDLQAFVGNAYTIEVDDVLITKQTETHIFINAQMSTKVTVDGKTSAFEPALVEFELAAHTGEWKIRSVTENDE
ncbi:hypothetical protein [Brevibacterium zhoupengii]|uniref:hypothetical protein n=1 Tax=Brevibacterium zhoupengii TaxID=2898795 RepID=UPI001E6037E2|nr:hypothetical protein [Brevibacterium zhoupengii]